jgi:hypothetical protein
MAHHFIANPCDHDQGLNLYRMWLGQVGTRQVYVWATSFDDAFELLVDYADDAGWCGFFVTITEDDLKDAASDIGVPWASHWPDDSDPTFTRVRDNAEADLTIIGHTSLSCEKTLGGPLYVHSDEWGGDEIVGQQAVREMARESQEECYGHDFLVGDEVTFKEFEPDGTPGARHRPGPQLRYIIDHVDDEYASLHGVPGTATDDRLWEDIPVGDLFHLDFIYEGGKQGSESGRSSGPAMRPHDVPKKRSEGDKLFGKKRDNGMNGISRRRRR